MKILRMLCVIACEKYTSANYRGRRNYQLWSVSGYPFNFQIGASSCGCGKEGVSHNTGVPIVSPILSVDTAQSVIYLKEQ